MKELRKDVTKLAREICLILFGATIALMFACALQLMYISWGYTFYILAIAWLTCLSSYLILNRYR